MSAAAAIDDANPFGYPPPIWQRFLSAPRAGVLDAALPGVVRGRAGTPAARSVLELSLRIVDGRVVDAAFRAYGCPASIAVGAWLAETAIGASPADLRTLDATRIRAALEIPDDRTHCALLGEDALRAALAADRERP